MADIEESYSDWEGKSGRLNNVEEAYKKTPHLGPLPHRGEEVIGSKTLSK